MSKIVVSAVRGDAAAPFAAGEYTPKRRLELEDGSLAVFDLGTNKGRVEAQIVDELRGLMHPIFFELDERTGLVLRVRVPLVFRVEALQPSDDGDLRVILEMSHAVHILRKSHPQYEEIRGILQEAEKSGSTVVLTEDDQEEILDVRVAPFPTAPALLPTWAEAPGFDIKQDLSAIAEKTAQAMFDLVAKTTCEPKTAPSPCIPFMYPNDGCWARAHEMVRLMLAAGTQPGKAWLYGDLTVKTRNAPTCLVNWRYHVTPILKVALGPQPVTYAIDPALFDGPVPLGEWKKAQTNTGDVVESDAGVYYRSKDGKVSYDPTYTDTVFRLMEFRAKLKERALGKNGPPPYAHCHA